jgi:glycerate-2-kinase
MGDEQNRDWAQWDRWVKAHISIAMAENNAAFEQVMAKVIAEERRRMRKHVAKELGELRAEITILRSLLNGEVRQLKGTVSNVA